MEKIRWPLPSTPFGVQAYALLRSGSPSGIANEDPKTGFGFFLEQGLGKTKTTLADFQNRYDAGLNDCMVVVTVNSMKATWRREMEDERYPFEIHVWPDFEDLPDRNDGVVVIMNYEATFRRGGDIVFEWMRRGRPYIVFDESTCLMNHATSQSRACVKMAAVSGAKRCLAGKPNPNGPHNLWAQLKIIGCDVGNFYAFRNAFCVMGGFKGKVVTGQRNVDRLTEIMKPYVFFAPKTIWAPSLPGKRYATLEAPMTEEKQIEAYGTMANKLYTEISNGTVVEIKQALNKAIKLQQISSGFVYDDDGVAHSVCKGESPKVTLIRDFVRNATGKTIIFAHFTRTIEILLDVFSGAPFAISKTRMPESELEANKARFNSNDCEMPFIAATSVLKFGHTLIGTRENPCQNVVFFENDYSLLTRSQAESRSHRWGATADIITYYDVVSSEVDRHMVKALQKKENLSSALLNAITGK